MSRGYKGRKPKDFDKNKRNKGGPRQGDYANREKKGGEYDPADSAPEEKDIGKPQQPTPPPKDDAQMEYLTRVMFKDLQFKGVIATKADPQAQVLSTSTPYPYLDKTNRVLDAKYPGDNNLDGNIVSQVLTDDDSLLLQTFDCGELTLKLNYLYQAISPTDKNQALNVEISQVIDESLSSTTSEMFTNLAFFTYVITSDMPNIDSEKRQAWLTWYQSILQNTAIICGRYNNLRSYEQRLIDMGFRREATHLRDFFNQINKTTFSANLESLSSIVMGEYFDFDWNKQVNILSMVPSRKTNGMVDPVLTITAYHKLPNVKVMTAESKLKVFDSADFTIKPEKSTKTYTLEELFAEIINRLNPYYVLKWARGYLAGSDKRTPKEVANSIEYLLQALKKLLTKFVSTQGALRTVLDRSGKIGLNYWKTGATFSLKSFPEARFDFNMLVQDTFASYGSSADEMIFDSDTRRWRFFTTWDKYLGIPSYDKFSGGAFLTMSVRTLKSEANEDFTTVKWLVPKLFDVVDDSMHFINRIGFEVKITSTVYDNEALSGDRVFSRLNPLKTPSIKIRVATGSVLASADVPSAASALSQLIDTVFGFGQVEVATNVFDKNLSKDTLFFVDVQLNDVSNAMITYARNYSPFRVTTPDGSKTMGFLK